MNTFLILNLTGIFFVVQSFILIPSGVTKDDPILLGEDFRLEFAHQIEARGNRYQAISDTLGQRAADHELERQYHENMRFSQLKALEMVAGISEEEASQQIRLIKENLPLLTQNVESEAIFSFLSEQGKNNKEKLTSLMNYDLNQFADSQIDAFQKMAHDIGYKKVFSQMADHLRSRSFVGSMFTLDNVVMGVIGLVGLFFVVGGFIGTLLSVTYIANFQQFIIILIGSMAICSAGLAMTQGSGEYFSRSGFYSF